MSLIKKVRGYAAAVTGVGALALTSVGAQAAIDTTEALAELESAGVAIAAIGGAILGLAGISLAYRWAKATFF